MAYLSSWLPSIYACSLTLPFYPFCCFAIFSVFFHFDLAFCRLFNSISYTHACLHAYIHSFIHTYLPTYLPFLCSFLHSCSICSSMHSGSRTLIHPDMHASTHAPKCKSVFSLPQIYGNMLCLKVCYSNFTCG